jgi:hypothetical protein
MRYALMNLRRSYRQTQIVLTIDNILKAALFSKENYFEHGKKIYSKN